MISIFLSFISNLTRPWYWRFQSRSMNLIGFIKAFANSEIFLSKKGFQSDINRNKSLDNVLSCQKSCIHYLSLLRIKTIWFTLVEIQMLNHSYQKPIELYFVQISLKKKKKKDKTWIDLIRWKVKSSKVFVYFEKVDQL